MARLPRLSIGGLPHHVIQRGHGHYPVFADDDDRRSYLRALGEAAAASAVAVHAYALLDDEIQLIATPADGQALGRMMQRLGRRYVASFNRRHGHTGSAWAGRFRASVLEPSEYLLPCMRFVESLPVDRGLAVAPAHYEWSSARHHAGICRDSLIAEHPRFWTLGNTPFDRESAYRQLAELPLTSRQKLEIAQASYKGWALGRIELPSESRRLRPLPRGRRSENTLSPFDPALIRDHKKMGTD